MPNKRSLYAILDAIEDGTLTPREARMVASIVLTAGAQKNATFAGEIILEKYATLETEFYATRERPS